MHYILVGHTPMAVDMWTWAEDVERRSRSIRDGNGDHCRVGRTELTDAWLRLDRERDLQQFMLLEISSEPDQWHEPTK
jgi:hypothetical protein